MPNGRTGQWDTPNLFSQPERTPNGEPEEQAWNLLALSRVKGLGLSGLTALYDRFRNLTQIWHTDTAELANILRDLKIRGADRLAHDIDAHREQSLEVGAQDYETLTGRGVSLLVDSHPHFPTRLKSIPAAPRWLFAQGNTALLTRNSIVAVVGTRSPSPEGFRSALAFGALLAEWGFVVASGLAEGIDAAAHTSTVDNGGDTIAVLGNGLDIDFPASNRELRQRIVENGGLIVTEYFPWMSYNRQTFVQRNRIIAGLSAALFPIESRLQSGTAHAVNFAMEYGRRVLGVTASHLNPWNEMAAALREQEKLYDLRDPAQRATVQNLLSEFATDVRPADMNSAAILTRRFGSGFQRIADAMRRQPLNDEGRAWLREQFEKLLRNGEFHHGS